MKLQQILEEYGLKERHALIYLASLELGSAPIQKISLRSGFARSTCDAVLSSLQAKGFVTSFKKKSIKYYSPEDPHKVVNFAKEKTKLLESALPQFQNIYKTADVFPTVRFYKGVVGMRSILQEILADEPDDLLSVGSVDDLYAVLGEHFPSFTKKRIEKRIPVRTILKQSEKAFERQKLGVHQLRDVRIFNQSYPCTGIIFVWKDKVAMFSLRKDIIALIIESKELVDIQRAMFELIWETLPAYSSR